MRGKAGHGRLGADFPFTPKALHMYGSIHFRADIAQMVFTLPYHSHLSTTMEVTQKNLATANEGCRLALEWMGETGSRDFTLYQDVCALHTCPPRTGALCTSATTNACCPCGTQWAWATAR
jgi:hypothetical protein